MPKSDNQKLKLFYIADYLMTETDGDYDKDAEEKHGVYIRDIREHLEKKGIIAEEHSISRDIALLRDVFGMDILGGRGKPYYLCSRYIDFEDLSVIAECIGAAKFISKPESEKLVNLLKKFCSKYQADRISSDYFVAERPRSTQKSMLKSLSSVRDAIAQNRKITFQYTRRTVNNLSKPELRRNGRPYTVSPFKVILSEGNHYLIGYDDTYKRILPYRIDRMAGISILYNEPRDAEDKYKRMSISDFTRQTFGMFISGEAKRVTILFDNSLLNAVLERFGNDYSTEYKRVDDKHFSLTTAIVISEVFYGWICGFGKKAVIQEPKEEVDRFKEFLETVKQQYA